MLTFLCKSSRGLESQKPVLAMVKAEDRVPVPAAAATYPRVSAVVWNRERRHAAWTAADKYRWATLIGVGTPVSR